MKKTRASCRGFSHDSVPNASLAFSRAVQVRVTTLPRAAELRRLLPIIAGQAFGLGCGIVGVKITSSLVPPELLGRYSIFLTFASVGMWAIHSGVIQFTSRHWANAADQRSLLRQILRAGARKLPWLFLACLGGAWATDWDNSAILLPFLFVAAGLLSIGTVTQTALQAARENWRDSGVLAVASASRAFVPPLLFALSGHAVALYAGFSLHAALFALAGLWALQRSIRGTEHVTADALPASYEGPLFIALAAAGWALLGLGRWVMALFFGAEATGYFSLASNLAILAPSVLATISLMYFQPGFFASTLETRADRLALARKVDGVALAHALCALLALGVLRLIMPWLVGPLIAKNYAPAVTYLLPAGCLALAITTGQFYRSLLLAGKREPACANVELTSAGILVIGCVVSATCGESWFLRWMLISPVVPWLINRTLARRYFLRET
jgi:O-antigen/teichoic acid export membrane protein